MPSLGEIMEEEEEISLESRNAIQKAAMVAIYDFLTYLSLGEEIDVKKIISSLTETSFEEGDYFLNKMVIEAVKHYKEAVDLFNANMRKWTFDRLNRVEQAILLLAYCHYFHFEDEKTDKAIIINVAIKQAKTYLEEKDAKFVNAILDKVLNDGGR